MLGIVDLKSLFNAVKEKPIVFISLIIVLGFIIYNAFNLIIIPEKNKKIKELENENIELKVRLTTIEAQEKTQKSLQKQVQQVKAEVPQRVQKEVEEETQKLQKEFQELREQVRKLKEKLEQGSDSWQAERFPSNHVVKDLEGYYYVIDIRDAYRQEIIKFKTGEYTIDDFDRRFGKSLANFTNQILRELSPLSIPHGIFIKGSADILGHNTFRRKFHPLYIFERIDVYEKVGGISKYRYIRKYKSDSISEPIRNENLPNLRARFIQSKLKDVYPELKEAPILDGEVEPQLGQEYRNAMLLLFVKWPQGEENN